MKPRLCLEHKRRKTSTIIDGLNTVENQELSNADSWHRVPEVFNSVDKDKYNEAFIFYA